MRVFAFFLLAVGLAGCVPRVRAHDTPTPFVLATFEDDYGSTYEATWHHRGYARYHIVRWRPGENGGYLIARNDTANVTDGGRWTRIDWIRLAEMEPYDWAFCLSAFDALTAVAAESTRVARPETPRTGCNGYPFSRMRRATSAGPGS